VWSKAGCATNVHVYYNKKTNLIFDLGSLENSSLSAEIKSADQVFISHCHIDHFGAAFLHARQRSLIKSDSNANYYVPSESFSDFVLAKKSMEKLDENELPMNIIPVDASSTICLSNGMSVKPFPTKHRVPSLGYEICKTVKVLKEEYRCLSKDQRKKQFQAMTKEEIQDCYQKEEVVDFVYTGDCLFQSVVDYLSKCSFPIRTFAVECTFLGENGTADNVSVAHKKYHVHLSEIIAQHGLFENCESIVLLHMSQRYSLKNILNTLSTKLPSSLIYKVIPALDGFGVQNWVLQSYVQTCAHVVTQMKTEMVGKKALASKIIWECVTMCRPCIIRTQDEDTQSHFFAHDESRSLCHTLWLGYLAMDYFKSVGNGANIKATTMCIKAELLRKANIHLNESSQVKFHSLDSNVIKWDCFLVLRDGQRPEYFYQTDSVDVQQVRRPQVNG